MSDFLFEKILKDVKEIPSIEVIVPMLLGEPFCDRKFIQKLKLINSMLPDKKIVVFTNCSLLTRKKIGALAEIKNLKIFFSLNGASKGTRKELMKLDDYNHAVEMIELYKQTGRPYEVTIIKHSLVTEGELLEFKKQHENSLIISYKNFSGDKFEDSPKTHCTRAIKEMTIMFDGIVNLCCMDATGKITFGNTNKASVKDIWESKNRQMYATTHAEGCYLRGGPCSNCTKA